MRVCTSSLRQQCDLSERVSRIYLPVHVQVLRRGHGLLVEVIDMGILSDVAFIGAMQLVPKREDEWLPNVDGFFDLVRNPVGQGTMRP